MSANTITANFYAQVAATMRAEVAVCAACREIPGGLLVGFTRTGCTCLLTLTRHCPAGDAALDEWRRQREEWRAAFRVPALGCWEYTGVLGEPGKQEWLVGEWEWDEDNDTVL